MLRLIGSHVHAQVGTRGGSCLAAGPTVYCRRAAGILHKQLHTAQPAHEFSSWVPVPKKAPSCILCKIWATPNLYQAQARPRAGSPPPRVAAQWSGLGPSCLPGSPWCKAGPPQRLRTPTLHRSTPTLHIVPQGARNTQGRLTLVVRKPTVVLKMSRQHTMMAKEM